MSQLSLRNLEKSFGEAHIIKGINLDVADGEFVVFVGPSGCGKSTLLRMIAGLEDVTAGEIVIGGKKVNDLPPVQRGIAMVFQSYALYPHMTVFENIAFPLRVERRPNAEVKERVDRAAKVLQLDARLEQRPGTLSGGQRQRVAIGRAIVRNPDVFLFDEPLSNLDAALRVQMRAEIGKLHGDLGATMVYVTHDQVEAMTMADKIVVLNGGVIEQVGSPLELYHRPRNLFVAGFIGSPKMNFIKATGSPAKGGKINVELPGGAKLVLEGEAERVGAGGAVTLGVRPEHLSLDGAADATLTCKIRLAEYLGSESMFYGGLSDGSEIAVKAGGLAKADAGTALDVGIDVSSCHLFDSQGQAIVNGDLTR